MARERRYYSVTTAEILQFPSFSFFVRPVFFYIIIRLSEKKKREKISRSQL